ncbi:membrane protein insertase YidC [Desulfotalea psychrophila]|uniref:Membrane protein insertase YidC n=1 Tax=Desulfotalea psychrophila (strain LSv54 / DSM 12343) TaxID=177439 RepID=Q6APY9_DESPS|nr:membrane protein insertase YidC [Desulfotalea psychrophila]CAG35584.1 conserved hypothetical membrane protein [Desulfotalea psychrophila LSv54]
METKRALLAIVISFAILFGYQYFFPGLDQPVQTTSETQTTVNGTSAKQAGAIQEITAPVIPVVASAKYDRVPRDIVVDTDLYTATISEAGGALKSFVLKEQKETNAEDSPGMQLVNNSKTDGYPLTFSWGGAAPSNLLYTSQDSEVRFGSNGKARLIMTAKSSTGLVIERVYTFDKKTYLFDLDVRVVNQSGQALQGSAQLHQVSVPYESTEDNPAARFLFMGPVVYADGELTEIDPKDLEDGPQSFMGDIQWLGYESRYFMSMIVPYGLDGQTFTTSGGADLTKSFIAGGLDTLAAGAEKEYKYHVLYGPKKVEMLKSAGYDLDKAVNFGWFDIIAKPTLWLLNFFHSFTHNYGIAIILVTIMFKGIFWPITQKGMKSMKNMQKLQPKMAALKEKHKDDPTRMNKEVMSLYKAYKVNPLGGCLPMVLQIPVFFALYKVLLLSIELRHAPFMFWITDLSAPDRLWIGFNLPYLGGLPVLTLLMGASMFLQQKFSPTTADPTQAKIMMFLPVVFTFMFLNFASGLVLYWFVNNLLSILQQVLINRDVKHKTATA